MSESASAGSSIAKEEVGTPTQPIKKVEFYGMNKNVVVTGTVLSLIKIFQHNDQISKGLRNNFGKVIRQRESLVGDLAYLTAMLGGTAATYSLLQKYVSEEKDSKWRTLDSLSTIVAILFEGILMYNLGRNVKLNKKSAIPFQTFFTNNPKTLKILSSIFTITTLMGHKRGTNPLNSFLALLFIELIVLVNTLRYDKSGQFINMAKSNKLGMVLLILLPFLWDHFEKGKSGKENKASEYYTYVNIARVLLVLLLIFLYFGGGNALKLLLKLFFKALRLAK